MNTTDFKIKRYKVKFGPKEAAEPTPPYFEQFDQNDARRKCCFFYFGESQGFDENTKYKDGPTLDEYIAKGVMDEKVTAGEMLSMKDEDGGKLFSDVVEEYVKHQFDLVAQTNQEAADRYKVDLEKWETGFEDVWDLFAEDDASVEAIEKQPFFDGWTDDASIPLLNPAMGSVNVYYTVFDLNGTQKVVAVNGNCTDIDEVKEHPSFVRIIERDEEIDIAGDMIAFTEIPLHETPKTGISREIAIEISRLAEEEELCES